MNKLLVQNIRSNEEMAIRVLLEPFRALTPETKIVTKHGMPFSAVGSLVAEKYVKKDGKTFVVGMLGSHHAR